MWELTNGGEYALVQLDRSYPAGQALISSWTGPLVQLLRIVFATIVGCYKSIVGKLLIYIRRLTDAL